MRKPVFVAVMEQSAAPAGPWYLSGGVTPANCIAAYKAVSVASYALSKVNIINPGTYDLLDGEVAGPTWDAVNGWTSNGTNQYLRTGNLLYWGDGIKPSAGWSVIAKYSNLVPGGNTYLFGAGDGGSDQLWGMPVYGGAPPYDGHLYATNGNGQLDCGLGLTSGVLAVCGQNVYLNGTLMASTLPAWGGGQCPRGMAIMALSATSIAGYFPGSLQYIAFYDTILTAEQVAAIGGVINP